MAEPERRSSWKWKIVFAGVILLIIMPAMAIVPIVECPNFECDIVVHHSIPQVGCSALCSLCLGRGQISLYKLLRAP